MKTGLRKFAGFCLEGENGHRKNFCVSNKSTVISLALIGQFIIRSPGGRLSGNENIRAQFHHTANIGIRVFAFGQFFNFDVFPSLSRGAYSGCISSNFDSAHDFRRAEKRITMVLTCAPEPSLKQRRKDSVRADKNKDVQSVSDSAQTFRITANT